MIETMLSSLNNQSSQLFVGDTTLSQFFTDASFLDPPEVLNNFVPAQVTQDSDTDSAESEDESFRYLQRESFNDQLLNKQLNDQSLAVTQQVTEELFISSDEESSSSSSDDDSQNWENVEPIIKAASPIQIVISASSVVVPPIEVADDCLSVSQSSDEMYSSQSFVVRQASPEDLDDDLDIISISSPNESDTSDILPSPPSSLSADDIADMSLDELIREMEIVLIYDVEDETLLIDSDSDVIECVSPPSLPESATTTTITESSSGQWQTIESSSGQWETIEPLPSPLPELPELPEISEIQEVESSTPEVLDSDSDDEPSFMAVNVVGEPCEELVIDSIDMDQEDPMLLVNDMEKFSNCVVKIKRIDRRAFWSMESQRLVNEYCDVSGMKFQTMDPKVKVRTNFRKDFLDGSPSGREGDIVMSNVLATSKYFFLPLFVRV